LWSRRLIAFAGVGEVSLAREFKSDASFQGRAQDDRADQAFRRVSPGNRCPHRRFAAAQSAVDDPALPPTSFDLLMRSIETQEVGSCTLHRTLAKGGRKAECRQPLLPRWIGPMPGPVAATSDQYVLIDAKAVYVTVDRGDYGALPAGMFDRVIDTVPGKLNDEF